MRIVALFTVIAAGCSTTPYVCEGAPGAVIDGPELVAAVPTGGEPLGGPWTPVMVRVEERDQKSLFTTCLDGQPADDPLGLVRSRISVHGGGHDYLGLLDLTDVAPGPHELLVVATRGRGNRAWSRVPITVDPPPHRVTIEVTGPDGEPTWARVLVTDGTAPVPLVTVPDEADPGERDRAVSSLFVRGTAAVSLGEGHYRLLGIRGLRDDLAVAELDLTADATVALQITPSIVMPDHLTADLHVHTGASYDSYLPDQLRYRSLLASGLDVAVVTDHQMIIDPRPAIELVADPADPLRGLPGTEHHIREATGEERWIGHMNAFPLAGTEVPAARARSVGEAIGTYWDRQDKQPFPGSGDAVVVELNHPRGIHFFPDEPARRDIWGLFYKLGMDHDVALDEGANTWWGAEDPATGATAMDFDAMEIVNRFSWVLYREVRDDWFYLLDQGLFITGTGNSDSHALEVEVAGFPVNLVRMPPPTAGAELDVTAFVAAIDRGAVLVSNGPIVELTLGDALPGDLGVPGTAEVRVRAAPWVPVQEVRLVVGGEVVQREVLAHAAGTALDVSFAWPVTAPSDTWVLAEAGWPLQTEVGQPEVGGDYGLVAPGYVPLGFTNPVRIDADGDGSWTPSAR